MKNAILFVFLVLAIPILLTSNFTFAADTSEGKSVFASNCASCHNGGGNRINPDKSLSKEALEKYGLFSLEAIKHQVADGKPPMPAFKAKLNEKQIEDVAAYVLEQAEKNW